MTDHQIANFILYRAQKSGRQFNLSDPKLVIYSNGSLFCIAVKFSNYDDPFMLRFTRNNQRGIFRLKCDNPAFYGWRHALAHSFGDKSVFMADYSLESIPHYVKHYVSYAIIEALKSKGIGFDLYAIPYREDLPLIDPNETYEEAAIESDLMDVELAELTELPAL